jgi:hypothetical protein
MVPIPIGAASLLRPGDPESTSTSIESLCIGGIRCSRTASLTTRPSPQAGEYLKNADVRIDVSLGTGGGAAATI